MKRLRMLEKSLLLLFLHVMSTCEGLVFNTTDPSCSVTPMPPETPLPPCALNSSATLDEAIARAHQFAPVVHFHPLEETYLQVE